MAITTELQPVQEFKLIDPAKFSDEEKQRLVSIKQQINVDDSQAIIQFGASAQENISSFSDTVLNEVRSKDTGYVGDILTDLVVKVKDLNVQSLSGGSFLSKMPFIGGLVNKIKVFIAKFDKLSVQIEKITDQLESAKMQLLRDLTMLDTLYQKNKEYLRSLDVFIIAGEEKLQELKDQVLPQLKKTAETSGTSEDAQRLNDFNQLLNRFEKKIYDLKLSRMISIQAAPQIRLVQNNNQLLVERIQSSILNTIPLWKNQVVIAISIFRQQKALELQKKVTETTNDLLKRNAEMLKQNSVETARESERGIVDIETLKKVNDDLISTIEETLTIQREGKEKRRMAEVELTSIETKLKMKLMEASAKK